MGRLAHETQASRVLAHGMSLIRTTCDQRAAQSMQVRAVGRASSRPAEMGRPHRSQVP